jgi:hypothetical protein
MTASSLRIGMVLSGFLAAGVGALAPPAMVQFDVSRLGGFGERSPRLWPACCSWASSPPWRT